MKIFVHTKTHSADDDINNSDSLTSSADSSSSSNTISSSTTDSSSTILPESSSSIDLDSDTWTATRTLSVYVNRKKDDISSDTEEKRLDNEDIIGTNVQELVDSNKENIVSDTNLIDDDTNDAINADLPAVIPLTISVNKQINNPLTDIETTEEVSSTVTEITEEAVQAHQISESVDSTPLNENIDSVSVENLNLPLETVLTISINSSKKEEEVAEDLSNTSIIEEKATADSSSVSDQMDSSEELTTNEVDNSNTSELDTSVFDTVVLSDVSATILDEKIDLDESAEQSATELFEDVSGVDEDVRDTDFSDEETEEPSFENNDSNESIEDYQPVIVPIENVDYSQIPYHNNHAGNNSYTKSGPSSVKPSPRIQVNPPITTPEKKRKKRGISSIHPAFIVTVAAALLIVPVCLFNTLTIPSIANEIQEIEEEIEAEYFERTSQESSNTSRMNSNTENTTNNSRKSSGNVYNTSNDTKNSSSNRDSNENLDNTSSNEATNVNENVVVINENTNNDENVNDNTSSDDYDLYIEGNLFENDYVSEAPEDGEVLLAEPVYQEVVTNEVVPPNQNNDVPPAQESQPTLISTEGDTNTSTPLDIYAKTYPNVPSHKMTSEELSFSKDIFKAYNAWRVKHGLPTVAWSERCTNMAYASSVGCAQLGKLKHRLGIPEDSQHCYSDILQYATWKMNPVEAITSWQNSDGHRLMMQCPTTTEAGVGAYHINNEWYFAIVYDFELCNTGGY